MLMPFHAKAELSAPQQRYPAAKAAMLSGILRINRGIRKDSRSALWKKPHFRRGKKPAKPSVSSSCVQAYAIGQRLTDHTINGPLPFCRQILHPKRNARLEDTLRLYGKFDPGPVIVCSRPLQADFPALSRCCRQLKGTFLSLFPPAKSRLSFPQRFVQYDSLRPFGSR